MERCYFGDPFCARHPTTMPGLDRTPSFGLCAVGHPAGHLWTVPRDGKRYCRNHLNPDYLRLRFKEPS